MIVVIQRWRLGSLWETRCALEESSSRYAREMHYLESLVFHVAFREGRVSIGRVYELGPGIRACPVYRRHLDLIFEFGPLKRQLLVDVKTGNATLTRHARRLVKYAGSSKDVGTAWILPAEKIRFQHRTCHIFPLR